ncbi:hypothetical protein M4L39_14510 [Staphylococcus equorum]|uniref:hypothetical protein n=1 Tax=Staphylococcus equorum TaxID=246432 RepID=UPI002407CFE2|nr:hypothetical protein [Staphylococcus equorum]MDG0844618.1 hypothetical protein [Staphylococcus equorum]
MAIWSVLADLSGLIVLESHQPTYIAFRPCALVGDDETLCRLFEWVAYIWILKCEPISLG